jgi:tRNA(Ile2) C34 agmatinyltransferase TiaS
MEIDSNTLAKLMRDAIALYEENRTTHGYERERAAASAVVDTIEGYEVGLQLKAEEHEQAAPTCYNCGGSNLSEVGPFDGEINEYRCDDCGTGLVPAAFYGL